MPKRKCKSQNKPSPFLVNMPLAGKNNYTNQQIVTLMLKMLANRYMHDVEYRQRRAEYIKNKSQTQTQTIKSASTDQNASFTDTITDPKVDLHPIVTPMLIILAEYYLHDLEYRQKQKRDECIKNKSQTQTITPASTDQNASFTDTITDPKLDLHPKNEDGYAEDCYAVSLFHYYNSFVEKPEKESFISEDQQNVGSNLQGPIQVGSFCFVPTV